MILMNKYFKLWVKIVIYKLIINSCLEFDIKVKSKGIKGDFNFFFLKYLLKCLNLLLCI